MKRSVGFCLKSAKKRNFHLLKVREGTNSLAFQTFVATGKGAASRRSSNSPRPSWNN